MYIIVAGVGVVGGDLTLKLVEKKHDVVVIDKDKETCDRLYSAAGVVAINGNGAHIETLHEAGINKADVVVGAMREDVDNLTCAILAKSLGVPQIIVRMRNPAYEDAYKLAGVTSIVRVADLMINQMMIEIGHPVVRIITTIGGGRGEIFMLVIPPGARIAGMSVEDIAKMPKFPKQCVFIATYSQESEEISFPRGNQIINEGDEVFLISPTENVKKAADFLTDMPRKKLLQNRNHE